MFFVGQRGRFARRTDRKPRLSSRFDLELDLLTKTGHIQLSVAKGGDDRYSKPAELATFSHKLQFDLSYQVYD